MLSKAHYLIICDPQSLFSSGDRIRIVRGMARQEKEVSNSLNFSIVWVKMARKDLEALKGKATSAQNESCSPRWKGASDPSRDCYRGDPIHSSEITRTERCNPALPLAVGERLETG